MLLDEQAVPGHPDRDLKDIAERRNAAGTAARDLVHARILLKTYDGPHGPAWTDVDFATALDTSASTVEHVRRRFVEQGPEARSATDRLVAHIEGGIQS